MAHWIMTANRLEDGGVAYLEDNGGWSSRIEHAWRSEDKSAAEARLVAARAAEALVCDPYVLEVEIEAEIPRPLTARERIRAEGPQPTLERLGYE